MPRRKGRRCTPRTIVDVGSPNAFRMCTAGEVFWGEPVLITDQHFKDAARHWQELLLSRKSEDPTGTLFVEKRLGMTLAEILQGG
jgi:hypothetical protein